MCSFSTFSTLIVPLLAEGTTTAISRCGPCQVGTRRIWGDASLLLDLGGYVLVQLDHVFDELVLRFIDIV